MPGIDAFSLVTSGQSFVPSAATEALVTDQQQLLVKTYGAKGQEIIDEAQAEADGINAYWKANNIDQPPATVNDVIAVTAFIGSIFGAGGGGEARNSELLDELQQQLGPVKGQKAWNDVMLSNDPGGADHHQPALPLRAADRRSRHRFAHDRRRARSSRSTDVRRLGRSATRHAQLAAVADAADGTDAWWRQHDRHTARTRTAPTTPPARRPIARPRTSSS